MELVFNQVNLISSLFSSKEETSTCFPLQRKLDCFPKPGLFEVPSPVQKTSFVYSKSFFRKKNSPIVLLVQIPSQGRNSPSKPVPLPVQLTCFPLNEERNNNPIGWGRGTSLANPPPSRARKTDSMAGFLKKNLYKRTSMGKYSLRPRNASLRLENEPFSYDILRFE